VDRLDDFESKSLPEQMSLLSALVKENDFDAIPMLITLAEKVRKQEVAGLMLRDTLTSLLSGSEKHTVEHLSSGSREIREISIQVAGRKHFTSAVPILQDMAGQADANNDRDMLFSILTSLALIEPRDSLDLFRKHTGHEDSLISSLCIKTVGTLSDAERRNQ